MNWNQMNNVNTSLPGTNNAHSFRFLQTNVYSRPLTRISSKLNYVAQSDWGYQTRALLNDKTAHYYGLNQYLFYKVSDTWTWGIRYEWFRDEEGFRVGGFTGATNLDRDAASGKTKACVVCRPTVPATTVASTKSPWAPTGSPTPTR